MKYEVYGVCPSISNAQHIVDMLLADGFSTNNISILYPDIDTITTKENLSSIKKTKAPEGAVAGAAAGGIIGGSIGFLTELETIIIPGIGSIVVGGPLLAFLSATAVGGSLGLIIGALIGYGIPEKEAQNYENAIKAGNILLLVSTHLETELERAILILSKEGATQISSSSRATSN